MRRKVVENEVANVTKVSEKTCVVQANEERGQERSGVVMRY